MDHGPRAYGATDRIQCQKCPGKMIVSRRSPHPTLGDDYEIQVLSCLLCDYEVTRAVDEHGHEAD